MEGDLNQLRRDYKARSLDETDVALDPFAQFADWFREALNSGLIEPNAMTLATSSADGRPSARIVLLKGYGTDGFTFFTNYESHKGRDLNANPRAALVFYWAELERQVRIEGQVKQVSPSESDTYFQSRPPDARLGAWSSRQSEVVADRSVLENRLREVTERYPDPNQIPRPDFWGGYRLRPHRFEFWQGRPHRLHDRLGYRLDSRGVWTVERLSP